MSAQLDEIAIRMKVKAAMLQDSRAARGVADPPLPVAEAKPEAVKLQAPLKFERKRVVRFGSDEIVEPEEEEDVPTQPKVAEDDGPTDSDTGSDSEESPGEQQSSDDEEPPALESDTPTGDDQTSLVVVSSPSVPIASSDTTLVAASCEVVVPRLYRVASKSKVVVRDTPDEYNGDDLDLEKVYNVTKTTVSFTFWWFLTVVFCLGFMSVILAFRHPYQVGEAFDAVCGQAEIDLTAASQLELDNLRSTHKATCVDLVDCNWASAAYERVEIRAASWFTGAVPPKCRQNVNTLTCSLMANKITFLAATTIPSKTETLARCLAPLTSDPAAGIATVIWTKMSIFTGAVYSECKQLALGYAILQWLNGGAVGLSEIVSICGTVGSWIIGAYQAYYRVRYNVPLTSFRKTPSAA